MHMLSNIEDLIVLEYSPSQKAFHRTTVVEMLKSNIEALAMGKANDYRPVAVFDNEDEYDDRCPMYQHLLEDAIAKAGLVQLSHLTIDDILK